VDHITDDHDLGTYVAAYRDVSAYIDAIREGDWTSVVTIMNTTGCPPCLLECTGHIAASLGDQDVINAAVEMLLGRVRRAVAGTA